MITRKDYMANIKDSGMHRKYYAQFVNKEIENLILKHIGMDRLLASTSKNFNDIYIGDWDMMIVTLKDKRTGRVVTDQYMHGNFVGSFNTHIHNFNFDTSYINTALKRCGDIPSINSYVCIFKECARQMVERHRGE